MVTQHFSFFALTVAFSTAFVAVGCAHESPAAQNPPAPTYVAPTVEAAKPAPPAPAPVVSTRTGVFLDPTIMSACKIPQPKSFFAYDSADLTSSDMVGLIDVANCFRDGALKGKTMDIVGRTDPRGTATYNLQLGQSRADSVSAYLSGKGVAAKQITARSTGEAKAIGSDADSWAYDRRVDIRLVK